MNRLLICIMLWVFEIVLEWILIQLTGNLWDTENGPTAGDEINLVYPGFNSGWSLIQGFSKNDLLDTWSNS